MAIAALVLHVDPAAAATLRTQLAGDPSITVGQPQIAPAGVLLPVVAEAPDARSGEAQFEALRAREGVRFVDVVMVDFSDEGAC